MNQKGIALLIIVATIIAAAVAVGAGIYIVSRGDEGAPGGIGTADFRVETTAMGQTFTARVRVKNIGTPNVIYRTDQTIAGGEFLNIFDFGENKVWSWGTDVGHWMDVTDMANLRLYQQLFGGWVDQLSGWTEGEINFTDPTTGKPARIYDIVVNPDIPDTLFQPD